MDNTSIITQVTNPKEEEILSSNAEKGERCFCALKLVTVARFVSFNLPTILNERAASLRSRTIII